MVTGFDQQADTGSQPVQWLSGIMNPFKTEFLGEPAWKWGVFVVAMSLFLAAWSGVIRYMK